MACGSLMRLPPRHRHHDIDTMNIKVIVTPSYLEEQSDPANGRFVFAYTIQIHNAGDRSVQLLTRYWQVDHGNGRIEEIYGEGGVKQFT